MIRRLIAIALRSMPLAVSLFVLLNVVLTNQLAGLGNRVGEVEVQIESIEQENMVLAQRLASSSSLLTIHEKARELGFIKPSRHLTTEVQEFPVAFHQP